MMTHQWSRPRASTRVRWQKASQLVMGRWGGSNSNNVATLEWKPLVAQLLRLLLFLFLVFDLFSSENQKSEFYVTCSTGEIWPLTQMFVEYCTDLPAPSTAEKVSGLLVCNLQYSPFVSALKTHDVPWPI